MKAIFKLNYLRLILWVLLMLPKESSNWTDSLITTEKELQNSVSRLDYTGELFRITLA